MATDSVDPIFAPEPRPWWRGWAVGAALVVVTIAVLHHAKPRLLAFGEGGAGAGGRGSSTTWDAALPDGVSHGELRITIDANFDEEPPHRAAMVAAMPSFADHMPSRTGPPIVGSARVRVSPIRREKSGFRPFRVEERWEVRIAFEFEGSCDGHPLRCRGESPVHAQLEQIGLVAIDEFERDLAELLGSMIADEVGLEVDSGPWKW